jgi:hypothetical protein
MVETKTTLFQLENPIMMGAGCDGGDQDNSFPARATHHDGAGCDGGDQDNSLYTTHHNTTQNTHKGNYMVAKP